MNALEYSWSIFKDNQQIIAEIKFYKKIQYL